MAEEKKTPTPEDIMKEISNLKEAFSSFLEMYKDELNKQIQQPQMGHIAEEMLKCPECKKMLTNFVQELIPKKEEKKEEEKSEVKYIKKRISPGIIAKYRVEE